ncbi:MAG TPA: hypothetical protein PKA63_03880 [Oligoflexia bacterium]|nr:hypothetical protein [Oligoflexia bacterium]HMP47791.1 hypothetical protein [Oligoflexia bacterium]
MTDQSRETPPDSPPPNVSDEDLKKLKAKIAALKKKDESFNNLEIPQKSESQENFNYAIKNEIKFIEEELDKLIDKWEKILISALGKSSSIRSQGRRNPRHLECMSFYFMLDNELHAKEEDIEIQIIDDSNVESVNDVLPLFDLLDKDIINESNREKYLCVTETGTNALTHSRLDKAIRIYTEETKNDSPEESSTNNSLEPEPDLIDETCPGFYSCCLAFLFDFSLSILLIISLIKSYEQFLDTAAENNEIKQGIISPYLLEFINTHSERYSSFLNHLINSQVLLVDLLFLIPLSLVILNILTVMFFQSTIGQYAMGIVICRPEFYRAEILQRILRVMAGLLNLLTLGIRFLMMYRANNSYFCKISKTILARRENIILIEEVDE